MTPPSLPHLHIRPEHGWLNDPNGMVKIEGRWHVFFQHNPQRPVHDNIAWAHVSSADLVRWDTHPIAFAPTAGEPDAGGCWSGVFLPWLDRPAVAYSGVVDESLHSTVCVREALDEALDTWSLPYVVATTPAEVTQMRDPFCFEWGGRQFALLGARIGVDTAAVLLFSCDDPKSWSYEGVWLSDQDPVAAQLPEADIWECPQLVEVDGRWTLIVSLQLEGQLATVDYLLGQVEERDGLPRFVASSHGRVDEGEHFYAPQVARDEVGSWLLGWVRQEAQPDARGTAVSGCLTLPRRLSLVGDALVSAADQHWQAYADTHPSQPAEARGGCQLPRLGRTRGDARSVTIRCGTDSWDFDCPTRGFEIWTDGDVLELFRDETSSVTLRRPGATPWHLDADCTVQVTAVQAPPTPARPTGTPASAGASASGRR